MKGNGSITATKGGYRAFFTHNGKRISKRFATKQAAIDWLAINRSDVAMGEWVEPNSVTFGQWILEHLRYCSLRLKPATMNGYKQQAKKLAPLADIKLQKLNAFQLQKLIDTQPSPSAKMLLYKFIAVVIKRAAKMGIIKNNILCKLEPPKYNAPKKDVFTREEITRIFSALADNRYKAFFTLAFATGCRLGELAGLKIQCVRDGYIHIENTIYNSKDNAPKTESSVRNITLPPDIIAMLRREWERNGSMFNGYVFSNRDNSPFAAVTIEKHWHEILRSANVPYRNFHYIRHTHATMLLSEGVPITEVQHRLGHSNASITLNRYGHILIDNKDKVLSAVDKIVDGW